MTQSLASVDFGQGFQNLLNTVMHSLPKILVFLIVLVVGWIIAKALQKAIGMLLHRLRFDRFVERGAVGDALKRTSYDATTLITKIVYYALLLVTLQVAFGVFGNNPVSTMLNAIVGWLPKLMVAIVLIVVASAIARMVRDLLDGMLGELSYGRFIAGAASALIIVIGAFAALDQVGIANAVTEPVLYAGLATVGAILAIGIGGGAVKPMQARWERILDGMERETSRQVAAYQRGRNDAMRRPAQPPLQQAQHAQQVPQGPRPPMPPHDPRPPEPARFPRHGQP
jgi:Conserved TM helix